MRFPIPTVLTLVAAMMLVTPVQADTPEYQRAMAQAVRAAAGQVLPSIVTIELVGTAEVVATGRGQGPEVEQDAPTSGIIVDADGYVIASTIVTEKPSASILVVLPDGTRQTATVVARDSHRDLVLLKIDSDQPLVAANLTSSPKLNVGQTTIAVGRYGSDSSPMVSTGIYSAGGRLDGIALQTDARVPPALYGGALVDLYGNLLGVLIPAVAEGGAENSTSWYDSGIAFAIPADVIAAKLDRLKNGQDIKKGIIGIVAKGRDLNDDSTEVAAVRVRSPAEAAGIKAGDEVLAVDGTAVTSHQGIRQALGSLDAGETVAIKVKRGDSEQTFSVTLADSIPPLQPQRLGVIVRTTDGQVIVDAILPDSPAAESMEVGDVIAAVGEVSIDGDDSLRRQLISAEPDKPLAIEIVRGQKTTTSQVVPASIAGVLRSALPEAWTPSSEKPWRAEEIKLPESANQAAFTAPPAGSDLERLGLFVLLLSPGELTPDEAIKKWLGPARDSGVVVCAIAAEDSKRWQSKELEIIASFVAAVKKKAAIDPVAVAVGSAGSLAGGKASAADSMAMATALSQSKTFFGVAISSDTRVPAMRLRENEPGASLEILMPVAGLDDLPPWAPPVSANGYPIVRGGEVDQAALLGWVRRLQSI